MVESSKPIFTTKCCIYRVPHHIRNLNEDACTPKVVSIGPFHYGNDNLQNMESQKQLCCHKFIERAAKVGTTFEDLISYVVTLEPGVRAYYSHNIQLTAKELVKVIFVDCGFIFELFLKYYFNEKTEDDDIPSKPWLIDGIDLDLVLLENQLPFFVLDKIYNLAFASCQNDSEIKYPSLLDMTFRYFEPFKNVISRHSNTTTSIEHFTDLLRTFFLPPSEEQSSPKRDGTITHLNSATELNEAGVGFELHESNLLDLKIVKECCHWVKRPRCLKIPKIKVEDRTETLLRNMVALEQCHYPRHSYVTDYVTLLGYLMKTGKDVDLLVKNKIIHNVSSGDSYAVAKVFNGLGKNIIQDGFNSDYAAIFKELDEVCRSFWYSRKATLKRDYCNTPWKWVASFAASIVTILTVVQTVCSILQVV